VKAHYIYLQRENCLWTH